MLSARVDAEVLNTDLRADLDIGGHNLFDLDVKADLDHIFDWS